MKCSIDGARHALQQALVMLLVTAPSITFARGETLLNAAVITGSSRYSTIELTDVYAARIGQPVTRSMLDAIVADIEALYRRDGYVAPTIIADDAELKSATPRIHVLEARIHEIALRGNAGPYTDEIMDRASVLRAGPIDRVTTQKWLRDLNTLPGLRVQAHFEPRGAELRDMLLVLDASYDAVSGVLNLNNRGTEDLGRMLLGGRITANGVFGSNTALSVFGATTNELDRYRFGGASVELPSSLIATRVEVATSRARLVDDRQYDSERARLEFSARAVTSETWSLEPFVAIAMRDATTRDHAIETSDVRTRTASIGALSRHSSSEAGGYLRVNVARGLDAFGANVRSLSTVKPNIEFTKAGIELAFIRALSSQWRVRIDADGQWSDDDLPTNERFTFGGAVLGRAFDPAELIGDRGGALGLQLERTLPWQTTWLRNSAVFVQADYGYADDTILGSDDAGSVSAGLKASLASMSATLELSTPTVQSTFDHDARHVRAFAQIQVVF